MRVKWRDMVDPDVTCIVQAYNEWDEAVGAPQVRDLSGQRFHELEKGAAVDEEAYKQLAEQRKRAAANAAMAGKNEERRRSEQELAARVQVGGGQSCFTYAFTWKNRPEILLTRKTWEWVCVRASPCCVNPDYSRFT